MTDSTCEAKYIMASEAMKEAVWLRNFIAELEVAPSIEGPILLYCDSSSMIAQAKEPKAHHRTKYVLYQYLLVHEIVEWGDVGLQKIDEKENLADPFTKAVAVKEFDMFKCKMGIRYYSNWL